MTISKESKDILKEKIAHIQREIDYIDEQLSKHSPQLENIQRIVDSLKSRKAELKDIKQKLKVDSD